MALLFLVLIFSMINYFNSHKKNAETQSYLKLRQLDMLECGFNFQDTNTIICYLTEIKLNPEASYNSLIGISMIYNIIIPKSYFESNNITFLYDIIGDIMKYKQNNFINLTFDIIRSNNENQVIDNLIEILQNTHNLTNKFLFRRLQKIVREPKVFALFNFTFNIYKDQFINIAEVFFKSTRLARLFYMIEDFLRKFQDVLFNFFYDLIRCYGEWNNIAYVVQDFILDNNKDNNKNTSFLEAIREIIKDKAIVDEIKDMFEFDIGTAVMTEIISNAEIMDFLIDNLYNDTFVRDTSSVMGNLENTSHFAYIIPGIVDNFFINNRKYFYILLEATVNIVRNLVKEESFRTFVAGDLIQRLEKYILEEQNSTSISLSDNCYFLFNYTFFSNFSENIQNFRFFYIKKLFIESSKNKNDFLTYENCLSSSFDSNYGDVYGIKPIFLVGEVNDDYNRAKLKDSIISQKYNFLISMCVPYGEYKNTKEPLCSLEDYNSLLKLFNDISFNMNSSSVNSFFLDKDKVKLNNMDYLYFSISIIIILFPVLIYIFLKIYEKTVLQNHKKSEITYQLNIDNEEENYRINDSKESIIPKEESNTNISTPQWYDLLSEYFDIIGNGSELFNYSLIQSIYYNLNGITYIKGVLGISIFLNILGHTFFILLNLPTKILGSYQFYNTLKNPLYFILFIGLRYSPRVIFSCSGYTLVYKFMCFLEQEPGNYFLKFLIQQSHKYILLILISLFMRYSIYYMGIVFHGERNPMFELFKNRMANKNKNYFSNLFTLLFYNLFGKEFEKEQSEIQYLYLPINEVFLFIFGISLISLGYKYKLRFDLIIITIIILIYIAKLLIFFLYMYDNKLYSTLYFYLFGYGALILNPLFNLPSFLIGMFFGLVNYIIQRGINITHKAADYSKIELQDLSSEDKINEAKKEKKIMHFENIISKNPTMKRILTYNFMKKASLNTSPSFGNSFRNTYEEELEKNQTKDTFNSKYEIMDKIKEMSFLNSVIDFTNFHKRNQSRFYFKIIFFLFLIIIGLFISIQYIYVLNLNFSSGEKISDVLSLETIIPNYFLNVIYTIDIDLVVIMVHWIFFYLYFKESQINDFLDHIFWSFFIKSYFSYSLVLSPVILYIFYQSETVIAITFDNIILYSFISIFFVFIFIIIFYSFYEYPLRKIFKILKIRRDYTNLEDNDYYDDSSIKDGI